MWLSSSYVINNGWLGDFKKDIIEVEWMVTSILKSYASLFDSWTVLGLDIFKRSSETTFEGKERSEKVLPSESFQNLFIATYKGST